MEWVLKVKGLQGAHSISVARVAIQWRVLVNTVTNYLVPVKAGLPQMKETLYHGVTYLVHINTILASEVHLQRSISTRLLARLSPFKPMLRSYPQTGH